MCHQIFNANIAKKTIYTRTTEKNIVYTPIIGKGRAVASANIEIIR